MQFTYYGHACFAVEAGGKRLLFDPFISGNDLAKDIDISKIQADYILLSHGHGDHVADAVQIAKNTGATIIGAAEVTGWMQKQGAEKVHGMNYGSFTFPFGRLSFVPAWHSSSMPDGTYGGNPGGFVLKTDNGSFWYAGDTCLMMDMQLIQHYAAIDFAVLPIGGNYTMDVTDAVKAAQMAKATKVVGVHYDTWPPLKINKEESKAQFSAAGITLLLPEIGTTTEV